MARLGVAILFPIGHLGAECIVNEFAVRTLAIDVPRLLTTPALFAAWSPISSFNCAGLFVAILLRELWVVNLGYVVALVRVGYLLTVQTCVRSCLSTAPARQATSIPFVVLDVIVITCLGVARLSPIDGFFQTCFLARFIAQLVAITHTHHPSCFCSLTT